MTDTEKFADELGQVVFRLEACFWALREVAQLSGANQKIMGVYADVVSDLERLKELKARMMDDGWIKVEDQDPPMKQEVDIFHPRKYQEREVVSVGYAYVPDTDGDGEPIESADYVWVDCLNNKMVECWDDITHWRPRPEPPRGEEKAK